MLTPIPLLKQVAITICNLFQRWFILLTVVSAESTDVSLHIGNAAHGHHVLKPIIRLNWFYLLRMSRCKNVQR